MTEPLIGQCLNCGQNLKAGHVCPEMFLSSLNSLTLAQFHAINESRKIRWHLFSNRLWIGPDWGNELAGETGELCNEIKKRQRYEDNIQQANFSIELSDEKLKKEIGDVVICAELIAAHYGFSLEECVKHAFNKTSEKNGFPERL